MKLIINYDLSKAIGVANTGIDTDRFYSRVVLFTIVSTMLDITWRSFSLDDFLFHVGFGSIMYTGAEIFNKGKNISEAEKNLRKLCCELESINVYTNLDFLKKAVLYKTEYKLVRDDERKLLQQNKYIMVPTTGVLNGNEVSLLQEHEIGTDDYVLSRGEPTKVYSKKTSKVLV